MQEGVFERLRLIAVHSRMAFCWLAVEAQSSNMQSFYLQSHLDFPAKLGLSSSYWTAASYSPVGLINAFALNIEPERRPSRL